MSLRTLTLKAQIGRFTPTKWGKKAGGGWRDRGGVTTLVGILLGAGILLPSAALVIDVGGLYVERGELQSGADSAAVAVAKGCVAGKCTAAEIANQRAAARKYANANAKDGKAEVTQVCGRWGNLPACPPAAANLTACEGPAPTGNYVEVRVRTLNADGSTLVPPALAKTFAGNSDYDGTAVGACARATASDVCVSAKDATYKHTFNGPAGTATITAVSPLCGGQEQDFSLVSYTAPDAAFTVPQYLYDSETKSITSTTRSLSFKVDVPDCYNQVDFVFGSKIFNPLHSAVYGNRKVGSRDGSPGNTSSGPEAWYNGGNKACSPKPVVSFVSVADGSLKVNLSNGATANVDAAFTVTAGDLQQFRRVSKSNSTTVKIPPSVASNVVVVDSTFRTTTGKWKRP